VFNFDAIRIIPTVHIVFDNVLFVNILLIPVHIYTGHPNVQLLLAHVVVGPARDCAQLDVVIYRAGSSSLWRLRDHARQSRIGSAGQQTVSIFCFTILVSFSFFFLFLTIILPCDATCNVEYQLAFCFIRLSNIPQLTHFYPLFQHFTPTITIL